MPTINELIKGLLLIYFTLQNNGVRSGAVDRVLKGLTDHEFRPEGFAAGRDSLVNLLNTASPHRKKQVKGLLYSNDKKKFHEAIKMVSLALSVAWGVEQKLTLLLIIEHLRQSAIRGEAVIDFAQPDQESLRRLEEGLRKECSDIIHRAQAMTVN